MKHTRLTLIPLVASLAGTGCMVPGRTLSGLQTSFRHPAVNWVYQSGGQYGWTQLLYIPIPFGYPSYFSHFMSPGGVEDNRIWVYERQSEGGGCSGLYKSEYGPARIELNLETGVAFRKNAAADRYRRPHLDVANYQVVDDNPTILLNWQDDAGTHSTKILTLRHVVRETSGTAMLERIGDTLFIYIYYQLVISVDLNVLTGSSGSRPQDPP